MADGELLHTPKIWNCQHFGGGKDYHRRQLNAGLTGSSKFCDLNPGIRDSGRGSAQPLRPLDRVLHSIQIPFRVLWVGEHRVNQWILSGSFFARTERLIVLLQKWNH